MFVQLVRLNLIVSSMLSLGWKPLSLLDVLMEEGRVHNGFLFLLFGSRGSRNSRFFVVDFNRNNQAEQLFVFVSYLSLLDLKC